MVGSVLRNPRLKREGLGVLGVLGVWSVVGGSVLRNPRLKREGLGGVRGSLAAGDGFLDFG